MPPRLLPVDKDTGAIGPAAGGVRDRVAAWRRCCPDLSDTHREIQRLAREFAQGEVAPHAAEWNAAHHVPVDVLRRMGELGFLGVIIPEEDGGAGLDYTCLTLVIEEIAAADAGTSVGVAAQNSLGAGADRALRDAGAAPRGAARPSPPGSASPPTRSPSPTTAPTPGRCGRRRGRATAAAGR